MTDRERAIKYRKEARRYKRKYFELKRATEQAGHWISVKDRLPETTGQYLITVSSKTISGVDDNFVDVDDFFFNCLWDDWGNDVIAWMPAPEPYKEDNDGETI